MASLYLPDTIWSLIFSHLSLSECYAVMMTCKQWNRIFWEGLREIERLGVIRKYKFTDESVIQLVRRTAQTLRCVDLSWMSGLTDEGLKCLATLQDLRCLHVAGCRKITDQVREL
jgi:hypothetical protein